MDDIRDIRPPVETPVWVWLLIIAALCAVAAAIYLFLRRRKPVVVPLQPVNEPARPVGELALERLEELAQRKYPEQGMFKPFYSTLSDIIRHYLEARFSIKAPEMTTEEFLHFANTSAVLSSVHKQLLRDFLNGSDMVKFAKHEPTVNEAQANFDLAKKLIEETRHSRDLSAEALAKVESGNPES